MGAASAWHGAEPTRNSVASVNAPCASLSASQTSMRPSRSASATAAPDGDATSAVGVSPSRASRLRNPAFVQRSAKELRDAPSATSTSASASHTARETSPSAFTHAVEKALARAGGPATTTAGVVPGRHEEAREGAKGTLTDEGA